MNKPIKAILLVAMAAVVALVVWSRLGNAPQSDPLAINDPRSNQADQKARTTAGDASRTPPKKTAAEQPTPDGSERIPVPSKWALVPGDSVPTASNWEELIAGLSPEERELAEAFAARYPEAYRFTKPEQLRWMIESGYPSPREMVEAQLMPREDLVALAKSGNAKAQMLATDLEFDALFRDFEQMSDREKAQRSIPLLSMQDDLMASCSPFAGYVAMTYGRYRQRIYVNEQPLEVVTQLNYVAALGDWRAENAMQTAIAELGLPMLETSVLMSTSIGSFRPFLQRQCGTSSLPR